MSAIEILKSVVNVLKTESDNITASCLREIARKDTLEKADREFLEYLADRIEKS